MSIHITKAEDDGYFLVINSFGNPTRWFATWIEALNEAIQILQE